MLTIKKKIYNDNKGMNQYFISKIKVISIYISIEQIANELDILLRDSIDLYLLNMRNDEEYKFSSYYSSFLLDYLNNLTERGLIEKVEDV